MSESIRGRIAALEREMHGDRSQYPASVKLPPNYTPEEMNERLATCVEAEWRTLMLIDAMDSSIPECD